MDTARWCCMLCARKPYLDEFMQSQLMCEHPQEGALASGDVPLYTQCQLLFLLCRLLRRLVSIIRILLQVQQVLCNHIAVALDSDAHVGLQHKREPQ